MKKRDDVLHHVAGGVMFGCLIDEVDLSLVDPHAVTFRACFDLDAATFRWNERHTALRALHEMGATFGGGRRCIALRPQLLDQLRVAACEILFLVVARFVIHRFRHTAVWVFGVEVTGTESGASGFPLRASAAGIARGELLVPE